MLPQQQVDDGANASYARATSHAPGSWDGSGWQEGQLPAEARRGPPATAPSAGANDATQPTRRFTPSFWTQALGYTGLVLGGAAAGVMAHQMGYDWKLTAMIAALVGVAAGAVGVMIPLLLRALGWAILAALVGCVGAGSLYLLMHLAPVFVERFVR